MWLPPIIQEMSRRYVNSSQTRSNMSDERDATAIMMQINSSDVTGSGETKTLSLI